MSGIPQQESISQLLQVLTHLVSGDNSLRSAAESQLNNEWMAKAPDNLLMGLAQLARQSDVADLRAFSAVLTRRVAFKSIAVSNDSSPELPSLTPDTMLWQIVTEETRTFVKSQFLESLLRENHKTVRNKICDTLAEMARVCVGKQ
ncbi:hypothetical protein BGZ76_009094, partial [Entomortierella beljakovae]